MPEQLHHGGDLSFGCKMKGFSMEYTWISLVRILIYIILNIILEINVYYALWNVENIGLQLQSTLQ